MDVYKLVVSDFHVGSGQLMEDGSINPFEYFIFDSRFIGFLDYYSSGDFKRADVELILNGDFLNTLQVDYRDRFPTEISEAVALGKVERIFEGHPEMFEALARFGRTPNHRITYIVGNHDPAVNWPRVRELISEKLGTAVNFPGFEYKFDGIWIEHGNQFTASNRFDTSRLFKKSPSGELVLNLPWGAMWVIEYLNRVKKNRVYIDRVQPFGRYLFLGLFFDPFFAIPALALLAWVFARQRLADGKWRDPREINLTLQILKGMSIIPSLDNDARRILKKPGFHTVILAHNHQAAYRRFGRDKLYVNTGTWNDIVHLDIQNLGRQRRMTYAFIDYPDKKRPRTRLKIWKGTHQTEENVIF